MLLPPLDTGDVVCGTGHRPDGKIIPYEPQRWMPAIEWLRDEIAEAVLPWAEPITIISGMAIGFDMMLAVAALMARDDLGVQIRLVCAVPFPGQEKRWSREHQEWYHAILEQADEVVYVTDEHSKSSFLRRNVWMVDRAKYLVEMYDGSTTGGTFHCHNYACKEGFQRDGRIFNLYDQLIEQMAA